MTAETILFLVIAIGSWAQGYYYCKSKKISMFASMMNDEEAPKECRNISINSHNGRYHTIKADLPDDFDQKAETLVMVIQKEASK